MSETSAKSHLSLATNYGQPVTEHGEHEVTPARIKFNESSKTSERSISINELYPEKEILSKEISTLFLLLEEVANNLDHALEQFRNDNLLESDDSLSVIQSMMPELFCCRDVGDGFGSIIVALHNSLMNARGSIVNEKQIIAIKCVVDRLRTEPFLSFSEALDEIDELENAELIVEPQLLEAVIDDLSSDNE